MSDALSQWMWLAYQTADKNTRKIFDAVQVSPEFVMAEFERKYLPGLIASATEPRPGKKTTSRRAARELCHAAAYCIENDIAMPRQLKEYTLNGLHAGVKGESVDAALRLKRGAGQAKGADPLSVIASERRIAVRIFGLTTREGLSVPQAKERACEEFGIDTRRVEQIWQQYRPHPQAKACWQAWHERLFELMDNVPSPATGEACKAWWQDVQAHCRLIE